MRRLIGGVEGLTLITVDDSRHREPTPRIARWDVPGPAIREARPAPRSDHASRLPGPDRSSIVRCLAPDPGGAALWPWRSIP